MPQERKASYTESDTPPLTPQSMALRRGACLPNREAHAEDSTARICSKGYIKSYGRLTGPDRVRKSPAAQPNANSVAPLKPKYMPSPENKEKRHRAAINPVPETLSERNMPATMPKPMQTMGL